MSDIETQLTEVFSKSNGDFVDLRALRDILAPGDIRDAAKLIEAKKLREARAHIESNDLIAIRSSSDGKFEVHVDLALEYVLYKNKDLKQIVNHIRNNRPGGMRAVLESTPGLFERVKTVFGDAGIRHVRLDGKFYFAAPDLARLVLWDDAKKTPSAKNAIHSMEGAAMYDHSLQVELERTHQFSSGPKTPILDIRGAARLWACLPGARASAFRTTLADTWIRVFGGDLTLVDEIRRNREIQEQLPADHPGRVFGEAVAQSQPPSNQVVISPEQLQTIIASAVTTALQQRPTVDIGTLFDLQRSQFELQRSQFEMMQQQQFAFQEELSLIRAQIGRRPSRTQTNRTPSHTPAPSHNTLTPSQTETYVLRWWLTKTVPGEGRDSNLRCKQDAFPAFCTWADEMEYVRPDISTGFSLATNRLLAKSMIPNLKKSHKKLNGTTTTSFAGRKLV